MELKYNVTGERRKALVNAICDITGADKRYLGAPSFAYRVDYFAIDRNGTVSFDDRADSEEIENLIEQLDKAGFEAETVDYSDEPVGFSIGIPIAEITDEEYSEDTLDKIRAIGTDKELETAKSNKFSDVNGSHWAYSYINAATAIDWINGYADGTFKPDNKITRAEVVAIVNRVTDRSADSDYVKKNVTKLNRFTDLTDTSYWAYPDIAEAANTHMAVVSDSGETWVD